jgi:hypothetical protein
MFNDVNLPDSNSNEPLSHGYIKYSIKPAASFVQGSVINNRADIYFDFNEAVRTNTTETTADNFNSVAHITDHFGFEIYPNPLSSGNWQLITDEELTGKEVKIFDAGGRIVYSSRITNRQMQIDASAFTQGIYLLKLESSVVRMVKL